MVRVLICDASPVVRGGLQALLAGEPDIAVVDSTDSGPHAIALTRTKRPDVVVTGLDVAGCTGIELVRRLTELGPDIAPRVVVYAVSNADEILTDVLHAGANGLLVKNTSREELVTAVRAVANGEAVLAPAVTQRLVDWFRRPDTRREVALDRAVATLTAREREVLLLLAEGMQPEDIAGKLFIGVTTVRTHIYRVRNKLSLKDRAQLVSFAYRAGLMQSDRQPPAGDPGSPG